MPCLGSADFRVPPLWRQVVSANASAVRSMTGDVQGGSGGLWFNGTDTGHCLVANTRVRMLRTGVTASGGDWTCALPSTATPATSSSSPVVTQSEPKCMLVHVPLQL